MKKILTLALLALPTALITDQQASAWTNTKFSIGLNWSRQSGGNNFFWGLFRNGQPPCPDGAYPGYAPGHYGPQEFQYFGQKSGANPTQATPTRATPTTQQTAADGNTGYQPVNYSYDPSNPYSYYSYPQTYYGYQVPSYWYGR